MHADLTSLKTTMALVSEQKITLSTGPYGMKNALIRSEFSNTELFLYFLHRRYIDFSGGAVSVEYAAACSCCLSSNDSPFLAVFFRIDGGFRTLVFFCKVHVLVCCSTTGK